MKKKKFTKVELKKILQLLKSPDEESRHLGYSLYQNSEFRKYIRNKCFCIKEENLNIFYRFPLNSLVTKMYKNQSKEWNKKDSNDRKIVSLFKILKLYINNNILIYDYSYFKQRRNKRT